MYKILAVDDDPVVGELIRIGLIDAGYDVCVAQSGAMALNICAFFSPDLIVLDNVMPGLSGSETLVLLRRNIKMCDIPVVMLTGLSDVDSIVAGLNMGAEDYVIKPFKLAELAARIDAVIRRRATYLTSSENSATLN